MDCFSFCKIDWSAIGGMASAIVALFALFYTIKFRREDLYAKKASISVIKQEVFDRGAKLELVISFENYGVNSAEDVEIQFIADDSNMAREPLYNKTVKYPNPLDTHVPHYYSHLIDKTAKIPRVFFYFKVTYVDSVLKKSFDKEYFMKWDGMSAGVFNPNVYFQTHEEAEFFKKFINE